MSDITIFHNPSCGTSRNVLGVIRSAGHEPKVIEYLKTPLSRTQLADLLKRLKISARDLVRAKGELYEELKLADPKWTEEQLIGVMAEHPMLMNRPVVVTPRGARLCRPQETVLEIL